MLGLFAKQPLRLLLLLIVCTASFLTVTPAYALPGDCDGTITDDDIICAGDPVNPDTEVGLDSGDDIYVQNSGVTSLSVSGDAEPDGSRNTGNGGDDLLHRPLYDALNFAAVLSLPRNRPPGPIFEHLDQTCTS